MSELIELRQYTLHPGRRDELIALFDRNFVEPQEACGMQVIGQFRDIDRPDHFVWLRGFPDPEARAKSLEAFYTGPIWQAHRNAANATMISSDDVLQLRPVGAHADFPHAERPAPDALGNGKGAMVLGIHGLRGPNDPLLADLDDHRSQLAKAGLTATAMLVTDPSPNLFPRLPVREGEWVLAWLSRQADTASAAAALAQARNNVRLAPLFASALQIMRLVPTARSALTGA